MKSYVSRNGYLVLSFAGSIWEEDKKFVKEVLKAEWRYQLKEWWVKPTQEVLTLLDSNGWTCRDKTPLNTLVPGYTPPKPSVLNYSPAPMPNVHRVSLDAKWLPEGIRPYQVEAVKFIEACKGMCGIVLSPGAGKSLVAAAWLAQHKFDQPALIVCPASLKNHWRRELTKWGKLNSQILHSTFKATSLRTSVEALIVNPEILHKVERELMGKYSGIIIDEADMFAAESNIRVETMKRMQVFAQFFIPLTGTPIRNHPLDMWNLLTWMDGRYWHDRNAYVKRYCKPGVGYGGRMVFGADNLEELHERTKPFLFYKSIEEILPNLPTINNTIYETEADDAEYEAECKAIEQWLAEHNKDLGDFLEAENLDEQEMLIKARIMELSRTAYKLMRTKILEHIDSFLKDTDEQVVLVAYHKSVIEDLALRYKAEFVSGSVPAQNRQAIIDRFNAKEKQVLVLQMQAGGVGFSIPNCKYMMFPEINYSARDLIQMQGRIRRLTSTGNKAFYHFFTIKDSLAQRMLDAVSRKSRIASTVLTGETKDAIKDEITNYDSLD